MAVYAIGDIQGCYDELCTLLDKLKFDPGQDQLWLCGDLVNRGPKSLQSLRFIKSIEQSVVTVLGNHDLHLLAIAEGLAKTRDPGLHELLKASDADELLGWLRHRPLLHFDAGLDYCLVHAGIYPRWTLTQAKQHAAELETTLRGSDYHEFLNHMYGDQPALWSEQLTGWERLRFICNSFTRMRYCRIDGSLELHAKGTPDDPPDACYPWFQWPQREAIDTTILFGHWSTLGLHREGNVHSLDTGCVWGGQLTAYELGQAEDNHTMHDCAQSCQPGTP